MVSAIPIPELHFGANGIRFLTEFFGDEDPAHEFARLFVPPLSWRGLGACIVGDDGPRIVLVDGHARVGKSWTVAAAIAIAVDEEVPLDQVWSGGKDSLKLFPTGTESLSEGLGALGNALDSRRGRLRIVLLDDLLGTTRLRAVGDPAVVRAWLAFESSENELLRALGPHGVAVITNRSAIVVAFRAATGLSLRSRDSLHVVRLPMGVFDREGKVVGDYDEERLQEIARRYGVSGEPVAYASPHMLALRPLVIRGDWTEEQFREVASEDLFLDDLEQLYESAMLGSDNVVTPYLERARKALALSIAPGLLFMGEPTFRMLHLGPQELNDLSDDLHLRPTDQATRRVGTAILPSALFAMALRAFFREPDHLARLAASMQSWLPDLAPNEKAIAVRGLVERALLETDESGDLSPLAKDSLAAAVRACAEGEDREFLLWELSGLTGQTEDQSSLALFRSLRGGCVAAVGWSLWRFSCLRPFSAFAVTDFCGAWELVMKEQREPARIPGAFSALLQWVLWCVAQERALRPNPGLAGAALDRLKSLATCSEVLKVVLFDEAIWAAFTDEGTDAITLRDVNRELNHLGRELLDQMGWPSRMVAGPRERANIYFSLCWHNAWLTAPESKTLACEWFSEDIELAAMEHISYIADNLEYHWQHFVNQTAVWMREWCLGNPFEQERRRVLQSETGRHGEMAQSADENLARLIERIVHEGTAEMLRNVLLLAGMRTIGPESNRARICSAIAQRLANPNGALNPEKDQAAVMQAIYELSRQGVIFNQESKVAAVSYLEVPAREWIRICRGSARAAWDDYLAELRTATCLDVLPNMWTDVSTELADLIGDVA